MGTKHHHRVDTDKARKDAAARLKESADRSAYLVSATRALVDEGVRPHPYLVQPNTKEAEQ